MELPQIRYGDRIEKYRQIEFSGLNHNHGAADGEIWDMQNMSSQCFPLLSSREKRWRLRQLTEPGGIFVWDKLCWVEQGAFYYDGQKKGAVSLGEKQFAAMGQYIVILPDKCYYNVQTDEFGSMEAQWNGTSLTICDGVLYEEAAKANCLQASGVRWEDYFRTGDAVSISGCSQVLGNNQSAIIRTIDGDKLYFYEYTFTIPEDAESYTEKGAITVSRTVPDLLFACEMDNRLWGVTEHTLYGSKLGDIFNWNVYDGLDTDAWAVEPSAPGAFTGCFSYGGYPIAFKEENIYKVYGSLPSNFSAIGSATLGLAEGSGRSLAVAGETLFYMSRSGLMASTGGIPQPIGAPLGTERFCDAVGGSDGLRYFVSMTGSESGRGLWVYDTQKGVWHREDGLDVSHFAKVGSCLYMLDREGNIWITGPASEIPEGAEEEETISWFAEFSDFTHEDPNKKRAGKVQIRLELDGGATAQVLMQFDSNGVWHRMGPPMGEGVKRSYYLPVIPQRCDHYRLKIEGTGGCRIYGISREVAPRSALKSKYGRN